MLDGWEQNGVAWAPATNGPGATDMSASLIFAANVAATAAQFSCAHPTYSNHLVKPYGSCDQTVSLQARAHSILLARQLWRPERGGAHLQAWRHAHPLR